ncbi:MAG: hypothetical protein NC219_10580, partial [Prevotella sp.]|nr:hypothetical protein [Prevotella sp.]
KKIVSVLALSALVAGSVFAQPKISMNYRTRPIVFDFNQVKVGDAKTKSMTFLDLDGYAASQDNFSFSVSGEKAGVNFTFMPTATTANNSGFRINTYNAWMKFGGLQLAAGAWKDGVADGGYRVKKDVDAGNFEGVDMERFKLGGAFKTQTTFIDNMVSLAGSDNNLSMYAEYGVNINDDMTLKILASAISNDWYTGTNKDGDDTTSKTLASGFGFRVQFNMKDLFNAEAIVKSSANRNVAAGLYFQPKMVKNLDATVGGAFSFINDAAKEESAFEGWNVDLRVRYQINEQFSITTFNSLSAIDAEAGAAAAAGLAGATGKLGWATTINTKMLLWDTLDARYVISKDKIAAFLNVGLLTPIQKVDNDDDSYSPEWRVTPGVQIYAQGGAAITVGVAISGTSFETGNVKSSVFDIAIPMTFRVKL